MGVGGEEVMMGGGGGGAGGAGGGDELVEFRAAMTQLWLGGEDGEWFEYNAVDFDDRLDDWVQQDRDNEESYFDGGDGDGDDDDDDGGGGGGGGGGMSAKERLRARALAALAS